ncbi:AbiJ-NTD4 domain-containing protein [Thermomonas sp.]|uniref:AbiJ-NTD4 domain-containing protein n=1 Tax=Thermomonas sp. TaxID=1971895 RepID=UPI0035B29E94
MPTFSQRMGIKPVSDLVQLESMNDDLRTGLWNALDRDLFVKDRFNDSDFTEVLWRYHFKLPVDSRPITNTGFGMSYTRVWDQIRKHFFECVWNDVYDFVEFVLRCYPNDREIRRSIETTLARENSGYRLIDGHLSPISDPGEVREVALAIEDAHAPVKEHLRTALSLLTDRKNPDYRNSIKESISGVEAMANVVTGDSKATLGDALKILERNGKLHPALKEAFSKMYGYTSDADGIRHALMSEHNLSQADARYFLIVCSAFINLLKVQAA